MNKAINERLKLVEDGQKKILALLESSKSKKLKAKDEDEELEDEDEIIEQEDEDEIIEQEDEDEIEQEDEDETLEDEEDDIEQEDEDETLEDEEDDIEQEDEEEERPASRRAKKQTSRRRKKMTAPLSLRSLMREVKKLRKDLVASEQKSQARAVAGLGIKPIRRSTDARPSNPAQAARERTIKAWSKPLSK